MNSFPAYWLNTKIIFQLFAPISITSNECFGDRDGGNIEVFALKLQLIVPYRLSSLKDCF